MLNLFPIQFLALFAFFILRIFVGIALIIIAKRIDAAYQNGDIRMSVFVRWFLKCVLLGAGALFIVGMLTQLAALIIVVVSVTMLMFPFAHLQTQLPDRLVWFLLLGASLTLFITGAGVLAIDLPI